jgi:hypothetical protein
MSKRSLNQISNILNYDLKWDELNEKKNKIRKIQNDYKVNLKKLLEEAKILEEEINFLINKEEKELSPVTWGKRQSLLKGKISIKKLNISMINGTSFAIPLIHLGESKSYILTE